MNFEASSGYGTRLRGCRYEMNRESTFSFGSKRQKLLPGRYIFKPLKTNRSTMRQWRLYC